MTLERFVDNFWFYVLCVGLPTALATMVYVAATS